MIYFEVSLVSHRLFVAWRVLWTWLKEPLAILTQCFFEDGVLWTCVSLCQLSNQHTCELYGCIKDAPTTNTLWYEHGASVSNVTVFNLRIQWDISERLGLVRDVTSRWAFACVSLLFYCCNGLCKLIPGRHDDSSEPVSDCPSSPRSPVFIEPRAWEIFRSVTIITMAGLLHWCDGSCCCAAHVEYERSFLTRRWGHWHRLGIICAVLRWLDGLRLMQWTSAREAVLFTL